MSSNILVLVVSLSPALAMIIAETFAKRFAQACDDSSIIPEYGKGRQVAIAKRLHVTQEAVRKWFKGEALPRPDKMRELAEYLEVDEPWLALGVKPELGRNDRRRHLSVLEGAVHLVAGLIMLEGGHCAFPGDHDPNSDRVDLYAIMRGTQMAVHVSLAREVSEDHFSLTIPRKHDDVRLIGVVQAGLGKVHFIEMPLDLVTKHKQKSAGDFVIPVSRVDSQYVTGSQRWPRFKTFGEIV